jgi:hypothetical protein
VNCTVVWLFKFGVCKKINMLYVMGKSAVLMLKILDAKLKISVVRDFASLDVTSQKGGIFV